MPRNLLSKGLKFVTILGLPVTLSAGIAALYLWANNKAGPINQAVILLSKYRNLRKYIFAQAKLESGNFQSNIYRRTNNPMAMGKAYKRRQLGEKSNSGVFERGHSNPMQRYRNDTQGFRDLFLWFDYGRFPTSVGSIEQYVRELKKRWYFGLSEEEYLRRIKEWL